MDSYSAFFEYGEFIKTELDSKLKELEVQRVFVSGLVLDFCVKFTSLDAKKLNYKTYLVQDASKAFSVDGTADALQEMKENGIKIIDSNDLEDILKNGQDILENGQDINIASNYLLMVVLLFSNVFLKFMD